MRKERRSSPQILQLQQRIVALEKEVQNQWLGNHEEHCRPDWPHSGIHCYCPPPEILNHIKGVKE